MNSQFLENLNAPDVKYARMRRKVWDLRESDAGREQEFTHRLKIDPIVSRILASRGLESLEAARDFLDCSLAKLQNPFLLRDMEAAVKRIHRALDQREAILIYGDYDTDGTTSTAILLRAFQFLGHARVQYYIPHRLNEGYGLTREALEKLIARGGAAESGFESPQLIITVDNGISAVEAVEFANTHRIDVLVTDHHQAPEALPAALAIVNPNQPACNYPFKSLAGCGVTFKLVHALLREMECAEVEAKNFLASLLDLVAIGTVADIVPLQHENRSMVCHGLKRIPRTDKAGLQALLRVSGCIDRPMRPGIISYFLTPRLNAAGRMDHAGIAVELLTTEDPARAEELSQHLEELNELRRRLEAKILEDALRTAYAQCALEQERIIVIAGANWHLGVVGIVASRILDHFHRPVIILSIQDGKALGSARSLPALDIHHAIGQCEDLLLSFGGHKMAAGLKMEAARVDEFRARINRLCAEELAVEEPTPKIMIDVEIRPAELDLDSVAAIQQLEPFGSSNPEPLLVMYGMELMQPPQIVGNNHLKILLGAPPHQFGAIGYSFGAFLDDYRQGCRKVDVVFSPAISDWRGQRSVELEIKAIRPSEA